MQNTISASLITSLSNMWWHKCYYIQCCWLFSIKTRQVSCQFNLLQCKNGLTVLENSCNYHCKKPVFLLSATNRHEILSRRQCTTSNDHDITDSTSKLLV